MGNAAVFSRGSLRLFVTEDPRRHTLEVALTNTGREVFVVYRSYGTKWWTIPEDGEVLLTHGPAWGFDGEEWPKPPMMIFGGRPHLDEQIRLQQQEWWRAETWFSDRVAWDPRERPTEADVQSRRKTQLVTRLFVQVVAPPESLVGYRGRTDMHGWLPSKMWSEHAIGGVLELAAPVTMVVDSAPFANAPPDERPKRVRSKPVPAANP